MMLFDERIVSFNLFDGKISDRLVYLLNLIDGAVR